MSRKSTLSKRTQRFADQSLASARTAAKSGRKTAKSGWNDLADRFEQVADRTSSLAEDTKSRIKGAEREGRRRGKAAKDALAGREPKRPGRVAGAAAIGVAFGAVMAMVVRRLNAARERMHAEQAASAVADELRQADLRDELAKRDAEPLSDAELDSLGLGSRSNGSAAKPIAPRSSPAASTPASSSATPASTSAPESRKPTS